ncbi:ROK family transcriptional regulator [Actibacterium ureilyticum]|uniref:ROK family transcriptional regulator n=1 Tax=Actibacterium ureilyticum TaxID=1590614 RepID=UPI000BAAE306|nr:ROK family transcriptional regulator [Actibacterium ureilyticum]
MTTGQLSILHSGVNQSGVRAHNERLLLSTLHRHGALPGSAIARQTGLSPQTVSVILRKLEADGLVCRGERMRGKVGKPSVPMALCPDGVLSYGLKIGRRSADLVLMDLSGSVRRHMSIQYPYPVPDQVTAFLRDAFARISADLTPQEQARICGIGVARPFELWRWHEIVGAPQEALNVWKRVEIPALLADLTDLPVFELNDATAACRAEHMFGSGKRFGDYAYFFLGAFIGGGVVLNHDVFEGNRGNAGAMGPMLVAGDGGRKRQLLEVASFHVLEQELAAAGLDPAQLWRQPQDWSGIAPQVDRWADRTIQALAHAGLSVCAVIDFEAIVIDGAMPATLRRRLVDGVRAALSRLDARGLIVPQVAEGSIGADARAIGAACAPIIAQFLLNAHFGFAEA